MGPSSLEMPRLSQTRASRFIVYDKAQQYVRYIVNSSSGSMLRKMQRLVASSSQVSMPDEIALATAEKDAMNKAPEVTAERKNMLLQSIQAHLSKWTRLWHRD